jgi:exoribonuclease-2
MHLLYEDGGDIKVATLMTSGPSASENESLAIESLGGKRGKNNFYKKQKSKPKN